MHTISSSERCLPILNAILTVVEHYSTVFTNEDGNYLINELEAFNYHVYMLSTLLRNAGRVSLTLFTGQIGCARFQPGTISA